MSIALIVHGDGAHVIAGRPRGGHGVAALARGSVALSNFVARSCPAAGNIAAPPVASADARVALVLDSVGIPIVT